MTRIEGVGVGTGAGTGPVFWLDHDAPVVERSGEPADESTAATDPDRERERFTMARDAALRELQAEQSQAAAAIGAPGEDVLATHESFLTDPALEERVEAEIDAGAPAARAIAAAVQDWIDVFEERGGRTAGRADDLRDLRGRLLRALSSDTTWSIRDAPAGAVVLATHLPPSEAARLDPEAVAAVACVRGSTNGHAAILARAAGVPMVVDAGPELHRLQAGRTVAIDAGRGLVHDDPRGSPGLKDPSLGDAPAGAHDTEDSPVRTTAGLEIRVGANVGSGVEAERAARLGANGVVLFRSEVLAYRHGGIPDVEAQTAAYRDALDAFPDDQVTIRTFDFGGDKPLPTKQGADAGDPSNPTSHGAGAARHPPEDGGRGIERSLVESGELDSQLRALCCAGDEGAGSLVVLIPHVTRVEQVQEARERLETVAAQEGVEPPKVGAMVETPAAVLLAPDLAEVVDALSLGTNDLLAGLRGQSRDADTDPDPLTPVFLRSLVRTADAALDEGVPLSCCGELARDTAWARRFVALGVDALGVPPRDVAQTRDAVADLAVPALRERVRTAAEASTNSEVRRRLSEGERG